MCSRVRTPEGSATVLGHFLGPHSLIQHYLERLNLFSILGSQLGSANASILDHARTVGVLVQNVLTSPGPLYRISNWAAPIEASALGLSEEQKEALNDDRMARALDALGSERARGIWFRLALRILKEWNLSTDRVHFDTTSVTFQGEYRGSYDEPRITHGFNKDHRPDLKQLVFGLNVVSDGAVPLLHSVWNGNRTDDSVHKGNFDRVRSLLGTTDFVYVADSKLATASNMRHIARLQGKFVTVLPRTRRECRSFLKEVRDLGARWHSIYRQQDTRRRSDPPNVYSCFVGDEQKTSEGYRLIWYRSSLKVQVDRATRSRAMQKVELELAVLTEKLAKVSRKPKVRGTVMKDVRALLRRHGCTSFFKISLRRQKVLVARRLRPGRPRRDDPIRMEPRNCWRLEYERDEEVLQKERRVDGVFPLVAHGLDDKSRVSILKTYKYQPYLEKRFSQIKTELEIAPNYLKKPRRAASLLDIYFLAISVASLMERDLRRGMENAGIESLPLLPEGRETSTPTAPRILETFASFGWHEFRRGKELICFPPQLNALQRRVLCLMGAPPGLYQ